ncbi:hypothetical protein V8C86DRAFT_3100211 [Haematococcus lacustris]
MGGMMDVHAQFFEASHRNVKLWYRLTNKRHRNNTEAMPELRQLSTVLQEASATLHMVMPVFINVANTAVLAASVDWEPDCSVAQTIRATPCFYNRPWFDNVALNTEPESFAQLRLLFTAGDMKLAMADSRSLATSDG